MAMKTDYLVSCKKKKKKIKLVLQFNITFNNSNGVLIDLHRCEKRTAAHYDRRLDPGFERPVVL